jgi:hypothetical protein
MNRSGKTIIWNDITKIPDVVVDCERLGRCIICGSNYIFAEESEQFFGNIVTCCPKCDPTLPDDFFYRRDE